jgi:hypothetical protein
MPSKSKSQQRFFGLVRKCQKTGECLSPKIKKVADNISNKDAKDFASTKHKGLPNKRKRKTFKEYLEIKHPEFDYNESILGVLTNLGLGAAAVLKQALKKNKSNHDSIDGDYFQNLNNNNFKEKKYHIWTNKENTEHKEGNFVKKENNKIYIKPKYGDLIEISVSWLSPEDLKYVDAIEDFNKKSDELKLIKNKIDSTENEAEKNELLKNYKQIEMAYKQAGIKVKSFDN